MDTTELEKQATHQARLIEGAMLYLTLFLVVLCSFTALLLWSAGQPNPGAYLPRWLTANPAPEAVIPTEGEWK